MSNTKPILQQIAGFTITGFSVRTCNRDEFDPGKAKIPAIWQQFYASDLAGKTPAFGVYADYESDANGFYTLTAGIAENIVANALNSVNIQSGNYLVFKDTGPMPATVIAAWQQIWDYFAGKTNHKRNFLSDFEAYTAPNEISIYIGVDA
ncbi:GyrI-like domain-containing protein [Legionella sp. 27cVA30]|nr:effector binding domain-containing protein [Legionella sp. 27cVA30]MCP0913669.1 GyrI-like domain-containing protein [Legionella sp. 27cVA30]